MTTTSLSSSLAILAGPVLGSGSNKFGTIGNTLSKKDKKEKKRRNRTVSKISTAVTDRDSCISSNSTSQWYTSDTDNVSMSSINSNLSLFSTPTSTPSAIIELRQEVITVI